MNDTELDELLDTWKSPPPPASMRQHVRAALVPKPKTSWRAIFHRWRLGFAGAAVILLAVLVDRTAFSQKTSPPPYTVESAVFVHGGAFSSIDLGVTHWTYQRPTNFAMGSYNQDGSEVLLSWSTPPWVNATFLDAMLRLGDFVDRFKREFLLEPDSEAGTHASVYFGADERFVLGESIPLVSSGCRPPGRTGEVVGHDVVLGYPTMIGQFGGYKRRVTLWMAPQLSCFALLGGVERQLDNGSWVLVEEKHAVRITPRDGTSTTGGPGLTLLGTSERLADAIAHGWNQ